MKNVVNYRAETNIKPWGDMLKDIKEGNERSEWRDRVPYAYWKGNPNVSPIRKDLLTCNVSEKNDWNTHLYIQVTNSLLYIYIYIFSIHGDSQIS